MYPDINHGVIHDGFRLSPTRPMFDEHTDLNVRYQTIMCQVAQQQHICSKSVIFPSLDVDFDSVCGLDKWIRVTNCATIMSYNTRDSLWTKKQLSDTTEFVLKRNKERGQHNEGCKNKTVS